MKKSITIIVAAAENNAIGKDNDLIWSLPNDLKINLWAQYYNGKKNF